MRLAIDFDGVVCEGKYLVQPERAHETYLALKPYDNDTVEVFCGLVERHEVYIVTSRSYKNAHLTIQQWLWEQGALRLYEPAGIITRIEQIDKWHFINYLGADVMVDDSPRVWEDSRTSGRLYLGNGICKPEFILMDNPAWPENQACRDTTHHTPGETYTRCRSWKELESRIGAIDACISNR